MVKVGRVVQYRYLDRAKAGVESEIKLETLLRAALSEKRDADIIGKKARARIADLNQSGQLTLWNGLQGLDTGSILAGELILYKQGFDVPAIEEALDDESNRFPLSRFQTDGKSKPVEGAAYFAIIGDAVGIIQSNAVTARWLERYFTWMLKDISSHLDGESVVELNSKVGLGAKDLHRLGPAKSLTLHATSESRPPATSDTQEPSRTFRTKRKGKGATVVEILKFMGLGEDALESIRKDIPPGGSLEGDFLVYIKRGRNREEISIGTLDNAMRHSDPAAVEVERKGSKMKGNLQTLSEPVRVLETSIGLDPSDAIEQIIDVLYRWNKQGIITLGPEE